MRLFLALQQGDLTRRRSGLRAFGRQARAVLFRVCHTPFLHPQRQIGCGAVAVVQQEFRDVEADPARAHNGNGFAHLGLAPRSTST